MRGKKATAAAAALSMLSLAGCSPPPGGVDLSDSICLAVSFFALMASCVLSVLSLAVLCRARRERRGRGG